MIQQKGSSQADEEGERGTGKGIDNACNCRTPALYPLKFEGKVVKYFLPSLVTEFKKTDLEKYMYGNVNRNIPKNFVKVTYSSFGRKN